MSNQEDLRQEKLQEVEEEQMDSITGGGISPSKVNLGYSIYQAMWPIRRLLPPPTNPGPNLGRPTPPQPTGPQFHPQPSIPEDHEVTHPVHETFYTSQRIRSQINRG
jgi:hypothetical protein